MSNTHRSESVRPSEAEAQWRWQRLKARIHPFRYRIFTTLRYSNTPLTVNQIAAKLDEDPKKVYRHLNLLLDAKLVEVVGKERAHKTNAKLYSCPPLDLITHAKPKGVSENEYSQLSIQSTVNQMEEGLHRFLSQRDRFRDWPGDGQLFVTRDYHVTEEALQELRQSILDWHHKYVDATGDIPIHFTTGLFRLFDEEPSNNTSHKKKH